jgi:N-acetylglucosaminyl-diphospho-decaprenol L-rhamnosyltransferase
MNALAVIVVTWNSAHEIEAALSSLLRDLENAAHDARVLVVDNASTDRTVDFVREKFPSVEVLALSDNVGFARANNIGMRHLGIGSAEAAADFVLLLNPDTIVQPGAIQAMMSALQADPRVGVVGANLTFGDGSFQHGAYAFPGLRQLYAEFFWIPGRWREGRFNGRYARRLYQSEQPFEVDFVLGACMLVRAGVVAEVGGFDEAFFMYCEEVDWQWRIRQAGHVIQCVPTAHIVHLGGQSTSQVKARSVRNLWESRLRLYRKHYPAWKWRAARLLIGLGMRRLRARWVRCGGAGDVTAAYDHILKVVQAV